MCSILYDTLGLGTRAGQQCSTLVWILLDLGDSTACLLIAVLMLTGESTHNGFDYY